MTAFEPYECHPHPEQVADDPMSRIIHGLSRVVDAVLEIEDDVDRQIALDYIIDGPFARALQGERQKVDPWGRWMHSTYLDASTGHPEWRESVETRRIIDHWRGGQTAEGEFSDERLDANLIVSDTGLDNRKGQRLHIPMFDIDLPMRVVPSTNPDKGHLYIYKPMSWDNIVKLLDVLVEVGIVHKNYRAHSVERGSTTLRPAFVDKPVTGWSSESDEMPFPDEALDASLIPDYVRRSGDKQ